MLAALNSRMLRGFGDGTVRGLRATTAFRMVMRELEPMLALNVDKEARKDAMVIARASAAAVNRALPTRDVVDALLDTSKSIDREFLARLGGFPLRIVIRYDEVLPIRRQRIERLLAASFRVFATWPQFGSIREAIRNAFTREELQLELRELFALYVQETRALSRAVRLPLPLLPLRELAVDRLATVMNEVARRLASDSAQAVFRDRRAQDH